jgi:hypothetical protein
MATETTGTWDITVANQMDILDNLGEHYAPSLRIYPADRIAVVEADYGHGNGDGTPEAIWHGRVLREWLPSVIDAREAGDFLRSDEGRALLERVALGHSIEWNSNNHVGMMTDGASDALDALREGLECRTLDSECAGVWDASDWFPNGVQHGDGYVEMIGDESTRITAATTDAQLQTIADALDAEAAAELVSVRGTYNYLSGLRDDLRAEAEEEA